MNHQPKNLKMAARLDQLNAVTQPVILLQVLEVSAQSGIWNPPPPNKQSEEGVKGCCKFWPVDG